MHLAIVGRTVSVDSTVEKAEKRLGSNFDLMNEVTYNMFEVFGKSDETLINL